MDPRIRFAPLDGDVLTISKTLEFIFDFGSPKADLAYKIMPDILARTGATLKLGPELFDG